MKKEALLKRAAAHCFFIGVDDSGSELCKANTPYGIAAIQYIQEQVGMPADATFISTPDMTFTRNTIRWKSGFGYGGKITWGNKNDELAILNAKPNACGMIVGGLKELPDLKKLIKKMHHLRNNPFEIDGITVNWNFYLSNHFIDLFIVKKVAKTRRNFLPYAFIIHGSANEFTGDNDTGFGLYFDKSPLLYETAEHIMTPFGLFHILTGSKAKEYYKKYQMVDNFSKMKRRKVAELLFDDFTEIANENHQGLINMNEILLGCHHVPNKNHLFPMALRGDLPAYIVKGKPNLSPEMIDVLGFEHRAKDLGVYDRLLEANIAPHGAGYVLPDTLTVNKVVEVDHERYFEVEMVNDRGKKLVSEVRELPYNYRGRTVVLRALEVEQIEIIAKLIPQYVLKI